MSVLDLVQQHLGPNEIEQLSQQIGADPAATQSAVQAALPMMLGGMASNAREPGQANAIQGAMAEHASALGGLGGGLGGILGSLGGLGGLADVLGGGAAGGGAGGGLLDRVLGRQHGAVKDGVQQASGLDGSQVQRLLMMLAPIVLAALARRHSQQQATQATTGSAADLDNNGIPDVLEQEAQQARARTSPAIGGIVGKILDAATRH